MELESVAVSVGEETVTEDVEDLEWKAKVRDTQEFNVRTCLYLNYFFVNFYVKKRKLHGSIVIKGNIELCNVIICSLLFLFRN